MLPDMMHAKYLQEEYERRLKAERLVRLALKASAENAEATAYSSGQVIRLVARLVTTPWHWGWRLIRRWSGRQEAMLSIPMKQQR